MTLDRDPTPAGEPADRTVHVETWGCQMNVADSERMLAMLAERGYRTVDSAEEADLVLLNTCHIREKARHKVVSRLGVLRDLKAKKPGMRIAVTGCVAQAEGRRLLKEAPAIDLLLGPGRLDELPSLLDQREATGSTAVATGFKKEGNAHEAHVTTSPPTLTGKNEVSRYVNIQQGCDNYCTFCVVPFTRGHEISRPPEDILAECEKLIVGGARELTLLGQNVNSYGQDLVRDGRLASTDDGPFVELLRQVAALPGLDRLRFTTSNPQNFSRSLARLFGETPKLGRYLHLPVQSGSDEVLARMKRKVTADEYRERVAWIRAAVPDVALSTDLIVGFPGETEEQFEETLALVEETRFSFVYSFKYSPRNNTPAKRFPDQIPEDVKDRRLARLTELQDRITVELNRAEIGQEREVLFLYESRKAPGVFYGRTEHFRLVRVESHRDLVGRLLPVKIEDANKTALAGRLV